MKAVVFEQHGGPEVLEYREDVPEPAPGFGQVRVRVRAASVNFLDVWTRKGLPYKIEMPHILGNDGTGWPHQLRQPDSVVARARTDIADNHARPQLHQASELLSFLVCITRCFRRAAWAYDLRDRAPE